MSQSVADSVDLDEVVIARSPPHHEISLPSAQIALDARSLSTLDHQSRHDDVTSLHVHRDPCCHGNTGHGGHEANGVAEEISHYDRIDMSVDTELESASGDRNPKSGYEMKAAEGRQMLAASMKFREVTTRQCKFEIGEEWETFTTARNQSVSCPPTPLAGKKDGPNLGTDNKAYVPNESGTDMANAEADTDADADPKKDGKEPFPFHYLFNAPPSRGKDNKCLPNPYNRLNQRFHSALQCPCFLFFFFLCCVPAVHYMQWSDHQFDKGNQRRAKRYGTMATVFYVIGSIIGVAFLSVCIYFAAEYVSQFVS